MSNISIFPQSYISSNTNHESFLLYKSKPTPSFQLKKNNRFSSLMRYSSSMKDLSNKNGYENDIEKINLEMNMVNRELKIKTKEYLMIKKEHDKVKEENVIIINLLESLLSECQEVEDPLERRSKDVDKEENKMQLLISKLKKEYDLYKKELSNKDEILKKLKENERAVRLFELDEKIKEAEENLIQVRKDQESYMNEINIINNKTKKTHKKIQNIINENNNLKNEQKDYLNKIRVLSKENNNLDSKKTLLQEKVSSLQNNVDELLSSIEKQESEINSLKDDENKYNELNNQKIKNEKELNSQIKTINNLNDQINKKNRQIKEDERMIISFKNHLNLLKEKENDLKIEESKLEEYRKKKEEKQKVLDEIKKLNEIILKYKFRKYESSELSLEKVVSFNLNVPINLRI